MICPACQTPLGVENHSTGWDEELDGTMVVRSYYRCPKCNHITHDWDDDYVWLSEEHYPQGPF